MSTIPFANFTKGELSPELQARIDTSQYAAAAKKVRNFIVQKYGGLAFRPGFRLVAEVDDADKNIRYFPFQFNMEQAYVLALEDESMRLMAGGGMVIEQNLNIVSITKAAQAVVEVRYHEYVVGDRIYFYNIVGMTELNGQSGIVVAVGDTHHFTININTTGYGTFVSSDGDTRVGAPPAPPPPEPPPPAPPAPPPPPDTTEDGGSGSDVGEDPFWDFDYGDKHVF